VNLVDIVGFVCWPRRHEIFMALMWMRGIMLEEMPVIDDGSEAPAETEAERKKKELAEIWNLQRSKNRFA